MMRPDRIIRWVGLALALLTHAAPLSARGAWSETGIASWYGPGFAGRPTASGEIYNPDRLTAAHKTLPLGSLVRVYNLENGRTMIVRINDRGPFVGRRIIDLSRASAEVLDFKDSGLARVRIELIDKRASAPAYSGSRQFHESVQPLQHRGHALPRASKPVEVEDLEPPTQKPDLFIQVGAFRDLDHADRQADQLEALQMTPHVEYTDNLYRVLVGPFASREKVDETLRELKRSGIEGFLHTARR